MRVLLFLVLAAALAAYAFWIYLRVELAVPAARRLAIVRACVLALLLLLLFDPRIPSSGGRGSAPRWVLLDASASMSAIDAEGRSAWEGAAARARELDAEGWNVVRFAGIGLEGGASMLDEPTGLGSRLGPALQAAAEGGAREVRVLSDFRLEDAVALRAVLEALPLGVTFERFGGAVTNAGIGRFEVPDLLRPDGRPRAELEVHGGVIGDSITVELFEEDRSVATTRVPSPSPGFRSRATVELPMPSRSGRVRYSARVVVANDAFDTDDEAVTFTAVGYEAGALVLLSAAPDWEPRYLLPVLEEVTGLSGTGYLRAGPDRYVRLGRAVDRGGPVDSATVRRAATEAAVLVVHGLAGDTEAWIADLAAGPGRRLVVPLDANGAGAVGLEVAPPRTGEWYASPDVPTSPIAGSLVGVSLQGLPPLTSLMVPATPLRQAPLHLQLRGAGSPESGIVLVDRTTGRMAVTLASGFWRWAARDAGREPYRRFWSGVAGWLLGDPGSSVAEPRPEAWVFERGAPVRWRLAGDSVVSRVVVRGTDGVVVDTSVAGERLSTGALPPASYTYSVLAVSGDTLGAGRFDVTAVSSEMLPTGVVPEPATRNAALAGAGDGTGRPLRTMPWPYLLVMGLLCGEWVVRRRSGLR